jgi:hypothetical protein
MIFVWLMGGFIGLMVVIHMARPHYKEHCLSQAQFFVDLTTVVETERRWRPGNPLRSYALPLRLLFLLLLLVAFWLTFAERISGQVDMRQTVGVWLLMDTSASMSAVQNGQTRMEWGQLEASLAIAHALEAAEGSDICFRLSTFDMARRNLHSQADPSLLLNLLSQLTPRPLGTDVSLVRTIAGELSLDDGDMEDNIETGCPVTHLLVITDLPAPDWLAEINSVPIIWRDIAVPVANVGFTDLYAIRDPITGLVNNVHLEVTAFGVPPASVQVTVEGPTGRIIMDEQITDWTGAQVWRNSFTPDEEGAYQLRLSPGGAYAYDDVAEITIQGLGQLSVDWQLTDTTLPNLLNWHVVSGSQDLRVVAYDRPSDSTVPTLFVGNSYEHLANQPKSILDFDEGSPLLTDVNLDAVEQLGLTGPELSTDFIPVLRGEDDSIWLAQRRNPPAAYVPGLPVFRDDNLGRFSTLVFLNAVHWLVQQQPTIPLYTLTSPDQPELGDGRLALHSGEGNTATFPFSQGELDDLQPIRTQHEGRPVWHMLLSLAAAIFLVERGLAAYGGGRWR